VTGYQPTNMPRGSACGYRAKAVQAFLRLIANGGAA
jgi:hypothetical protein